MNPPTILLAPMEGLLDWPLRDLLTRAGGIDRCVTEFVRCSGTLLPERVFHRTIPELRNGGRTPAGVPVIAQLMGSDPHCLAENAVRLAGLGPAGIDLNFGCPAKAVNRHRGGAVLLDEPELVGRLVEAVRRVVPPEMPVSAKMRLGFRDASPALHCARAIAEAGASELTVHARTRADGYRPPAYWDKLAAIREAVDIPVVANGEIWTAEDAMRCMQVSGCDRIMLGRGIVTDPGLALAIRASGLRTTVWSEVAPLVHGYWRIVRAKVPAPAQPGRIKQWLSYLRHRFEEAAELFLEVRLQNDPVAVDRLVRARLAGGLDEEEATEGCEPALAAVG